MPGGAPESYRIAADAASVVVTGADAAGLFYGVQTLGQLIVRDGDGFAIAAVRIEDAPRFALPRASCSTSHATSSRSRP